MRDQSGPIAGLCLCLNRGYGKGCKSLGLSTDYHLQGSNPSSRMTMPLNTAVGSLGAGLYLICTISTSLSVWVKGRPKTFPKSPWDQRGIFTSQPSNSTLVYTLGIQCPRLPPDTTLCTSLQHMVGPWACVRNPLLTVARSCPDNVNLCLGDGHSDRQTLQIFYLWEGARFKGDSCVKKLVSHQPLLRCTDKKGRVREEWHIIKWTIKKFPNFWLQLTSELNPVPIFWLIVWWTQAAKLVWGVSQTLAWVFWWRKDLLSLWLRCLTRK